MSEKVKMDKAESNINPSSEAAHNEMATVLHRLTSVLTQENEMLSSTDEADHANYINAKSQALREMIKIYQAQQPSPYTPELLQHLCEVRKLIDRNSQLLKLQLSTLNDLTSFMK